jgi:FkbH-like protein
METDFLSDQTQPAQFVVPREMQYPVSADTVLRRRTALKRQLLQQSNLLPVKIAILGGSTTSDVKAMLELFLLAQGIQPTFYESAYNAYFEEVQFEKPELWSFQPDIVLLHTTWHNVSQFPSLLASEAEVNDLMQAEAARFERLWEKLQTAFGALIIQNNFDSPALNPLGHLDASSSFGRLRYLRCLNEAFAEYSAKHSRFLINDISYLCTEVGLANWFDASYWYNYHMAVSPTAAVAIGQNVAAIIKSAYGRSRKCLVLDLDNTLWGGVIGDVGMEHIALGKDHALGEAYGDFQRYVKELGRRGVMLAVCSKNELDIAKQGFSHPDSALKVDDFACIKANWNPKSDNIRDIAKELNIGLDSMVFVDDNPAERAIVSEQLPSVAVPDVGSDVTAYARIIEAEKYFEPSTIGADDVERTAYYQANAQRTEDQGRYANYGEFLNSLEMSAEIDAFVPVYLERITQLINKSNQFNLTTQRCTLAEVEAMAENSNYVTLYGRLADKFGDNGLVSVVIGRRNGDSLEVHTWLMSCRVLGREMELAMFDALVEKCEARGIREIVGVYIPTAKNRLVERHYANLGFTQDASGSVDKTTMWRYDLSKGYQPKTQYIRRTSQRTTTAVTV